MKNPIETNINYKANYFRLVANDNTTNVLPLEIDWTEINRNTHLMRGLKCLKLHEKASTDQKHVLSWSEKIKQVFHSNTISSSEVVENATHDSKIFQPHCKHCECWSNELSMLNLTVVFVPQSVISQLPPKIGTKKNLAPYFVSLPLYCCKQFINMIMRKKCHNSAVNVRALFNSPQLTHQIATNRGLITFWILFLRSRVWNLFSVHDV